MTEAENLPKKTNYANNSMKAQEGTGPDEVRPTIAPIASAQVKKQGLGSKFREAFTGDDAQTVGQYLFFDVVVPATKNLIFDMLSEGARRILFGGGARPSVRSGSSLGSRTGYSRAYSGGASVSQQPERRELTQHARDTHRFDQEIILPTRAEAEEVLDALIAYIDEYKSVTVADLYAAIDVTATHADTKHGWYSLSTAGVRNVRDGYMLELPPTRVIT